MTILVTGATGRVGRAVVTALLRAGRPVRALTRAPVTADLPEGVAVYQGDLEDPASLAAALEGADLLYLFPVPSTAREVVAMAERAGVRRAVVLSGALADEESADDEDGYGAVERAVQASGLDWTIVRPGEFAGNWLDYAPDVRARREVRRPFGNAVSRPTHEADVADVVAASLLGEGHSGQVYTFGGPEALTVAEQVRRIGAAIGAEVRFVELTPEQARMEWYDLDQGVDHDVIDWLLDMYGASVDGPETVPPSDTVERVTGSPPRDFAQWAADHADDFR
ncbi:uncharacterized protein YbjT (DUF2867 family) [Murinocardiopsis flavida]|uniref:Uncharacterized protein YbjT (DUF2867 family) n=1 Tax=Murinocardiopsis flavida TaxID=645275 RepID=A0A2P8DPF0_9ACTN|nr:NAD(P)H-binding protein [Murinocardiopsis flavida]PSK99088.1 uncharacterized protein YbjT (DUF2867 family) [Murinocardiopsis flavida]